MTQQDRREWHLDRRVMVALIGTLLMQALATGWWAASMDSRVRVAEERIQANARQIDKSRDAMSGVRADLARIDANIEALVNEVRQMNGRLDRRENRQ